MYTLKKPSSHLNRNLSNLTSSPHPRGTYKFLVKLTRSFLSNIWILFLVKIWGGILSYFDKNTFSEWLENLLTFEKELVKLTSLTYLRDTYEFLVKLNIWMWFLVKVWCKNLVILWQDYLFRTNKNCTLFQGSYAGLFGREQQKKVSLRSTLSLLFFGVL